MEEKVKVTINYGIPYTGVMSWDDDYFETDETWTEEHSSISSALKEIGKEFNIFSHEESDDGKRLRVWVY